MMILTCCEFWAGKLVRSFRGLRYVIWTVFFALPSFAFGQSIDVLKLCFESADVRPWRTADGKGLNFDLINGAARQLGIRVIYIGLPWKRCLSELKDNQLDGAFAASFKADRKDIGAFPGGETPDDSKRMHMDSYVVVRKKGSDVRWDGQVFSGLNGAVGIQLGYSIGDQLKAMRLPVDDGSVGLRELLLKLVSGRLGAAAIGGSDAKYLARLDPKLAQQLEVLPALLAKKAYFLMLSHQLLETRPELARRLWQAIEKERKTAAYLKKEEQALIGGQP